MPGILLDASHTTVNSTHRSSIFLPRGGIKCHDEAGIECYGPHVKGNT